MRKIFSLIVIFALIFAFSGCSDGRVCALPDEKDARILAKRPVAAPEVAESMEMARYMCANRVFVTADTVYTLDFDENYQPILASYERRGMELSQPKTLVNDCAPEWLCLYEGRLYYVNSFANGYIECFDPATGLRAVVVDKPSAYLSVREGRLYYCNERGFFCTAGLDGNGEQVIIGKSCCYPWFLGEAVIYQDENDGERLHLFWPSDGTDIKLSAEAAYAPVLLGEKLIYSAEGSIRAMNIDGYDPEEYITPPLCGAAELIYESGVWKMRGLSDDYGIEQWQTGLLGEMVEKCEEGLYRWCDYIDENVRVDAVYFTDGRLRDFELVGADGSIQRYISGKIVNHN